MKEYAEEYIVDSLNLFIESEVGRMVMNHEKQGGYLGVMLRYLCFTDKCNFVEATDMCIKFLCLRTKGDMSHHGISFDKIESLTSLTKLRFCAAMLRIKCDKLDVQSEIKNFRNIVNYMTKI